MVAPRIFVSYALTNVPKQEMTLIQQLINDLRSAGAEVVTDDLRVLDAQFLRFLQQQLADCQWLVLVQTTEAVRSLRTQITVETALQMVTQRKLRDVIRVILPSFTMPDEPEQWSGTTAILFQGDYPRLRDKLLLLLDLLHVGTASSRPLTGTGRDEAVSTERTWQYEAVSPQPKSGNGDRPQKARNASPLALFGRRNIATAVREPVVVRDRPIALPSSKRARRPWFFLSLGVSLLLLVVISTALFFRYGTILLSSKHYTALKTPISVMTTRVPHVPSPTATQPNMQSLAQDTFQRANQSLWGTASDGQMWTGDANSSAAFSIVNHSGQIVGTPGTNTYSALLGPTDTDVDVTVSGSVNQFVNNDNQVNLGVVLRWQNANNWYKLLIDGAQVAIVRHVNDVPKTLASMNFAAQNNVSYTLRFRAVGNTLFGKVWPSNQAEPANWMLSITDTTFTAGNVGVRAVLQNTIRVNITSFRAVGV